MELTGCNFIGQRESAQGESTYRAVNPAGSQNLEPSFCEATKKEVAEAAQLAAKAAPHYTALTPKARAGFLDRIAEEIESIGDLLTERANAESALGAVRLTGERGRTVGQLRLFATVVREGSWVQARIDRAIPDRAPLPKPDLRMMLVPVGPVAIFGASNFPLAFSVAGGDTASALAAGNPVVVKAHPAHPGTCELIARAILKAAAACEMPDGVFSMVHGAGPEVGLALVRHSRIQAVGFTGSLKAGRALFDAAAARLNPIPVFAEMGSVNPVFLLPEALSENAEAIAEGFAGSMTLGVGQFCTKPGLAFAIKGDDSDRFAVKLAEAISQKPPETMLYAGICQSFAEQARQVEQIPGVRLVARSESAPDSAQTQAAAAVFATSADTFLNDPSLAEEIFGPATLIVECNSAAQMREAAQSLDGQLTVTFQATESDMLQHRALVAIARDKAGRIVFNGFPTGVEVCPSMTHGGPYPATTNGNSTSVGTAAIFRFARPVSYQSFPQESLPTELRDTNELGIWRLVDNEMTKEDV